LGRYHPGKVGFPGSAGFKIEIFHQRIETGGEKKRREFWAKQGIYYSKGLYY